MRPLVRPAQAADLPGIAWALARAFADDPLMRHVVPAARFDDRLTALFRSEARWSLDQVTVAVVDGDVAGAALWRPPGRGTTRPWQALAATVDLARGLGRGFPHALRSFRTLERQHPASPPHWYLQTIGVARTGLGIGGALLRAGLDQVDAARMPAYLESSAPGNVPLYERFGFRVVGEIVLPDGGPTLPAMWRDPTPGTAHR